MNSIAGISTRTSVLLLLILVTGVSAVSADSDGTEARPKVSLLYTDGSIKEKSSSFPDDQTRYQKYTFDGKRGDEVEVGLNPAVLTWDKNGNPQEFAPGEFLRLRFDRGGRLETAPEEDGTHHFAHRFAEDGTLVFYVTTKKAGQVGAFWLGVRTKTRLQPDPVYGHVIKEGQIATGHTITFPYEITATRHLQAEVTGTGFTPIVEFGRGIKTFEVIPWGERRERGNVVWARADGPEGECSVRISVPGKGAGSFRLVWMIPFHLSPE